MENLKKLLIANRGEIACRIAKTAQKLGVRIIAVYTEPDSASQHVHVADEAYLLNGEERAAYLDGIAKTRGAQGIIPGYGFLSENADFARSVASSGLVFVGPSPEAIENFGLKHTARDLAMKAGVPIVPGSPGLLETEDAAILVAQNLGFPIMLKATAGGGGFGLLVCKEEKELRRNFKQVQSRGAALFRNSGVYLERYYPESHHIEVQLFGNGQGKVISFGERECSIQRRHQKLVEECPSPFVDKHPELRAQLVDCAVSLGESIDYGSVGTVEYLIDDNTGDFFFLEMNTRLQVEHGITEMCYNVDLVELMLRQADMQLGGQGGLKAEDLISLQKRCLKPQGHSIEARIYAENPIRNFAPSPGVLQEVVWHTGQGTRVDTWIRPGLMISPSYDPLLAKVMQHSATRTGTVARLKTVLEESVIHGPTTNIEFLSAVLQTPDFQVGNTLTQFLNNFEYMPEAIDIIAGGAYTVVQDYPGRPTVGHGFGHAGPMDPIAFQTANILVGNPIGLEGLEITLTGPELLFLSDAIVSLCGPDIPALLDSIVFPMWTGRRIRAGQRLKIGRMESGCRAYLAVHGGFRNIAKWLGSKSTHSMINLGGLQGRPIRTGDFLALISPAKLPNHALQSIPKELVPQYFNSWTIQVMPGPYESGFLSSKDIEALYSTTWKVSHNAARGGIRLLGPRLEFARSDGGEGGAHPSNILEYGYPIGALNWTGDEPVICTVDSPNCGGFICSLTVVKADWWKIGQIRAGAEVKFRRVSLKSALELRKRNETFLERVRMCVKVGSWADAIAFDSKALAPEVSKPGLDIVRTLGPTEARPTVTYRAGGDDFLLVDYGEGKFDLNHRCRAAKLDHALGEVQGFASCNRSQGGVILDTVGCGNSLMIFYDGSRLPRDQLLSVLLKIETSLGDLRATTIPNRRFKMPVTFTHPKLNDAMKRYMATQRSIASYLPDPFTFVAENNGLTKDELKRTLLDSEFVIIAVGFLMASPLGLPADPRHRLSAPKMNPSRTFTPEGTFSWGGSSMAIYPVDSPGGYMLLGMTLPGVDVYGCKTGFSQDKSWMFENMDVLTFYEVSEEEYDVLMAQFKSGSYKFQYSDSVFDMAEHNKLLLESADGARQQQAKMAVSQGKMVELEKKMLQKWLEEKETVEVNIGDIESFFLRDPEVKFIEAPMNANVWRVLVEDGDTLTAGQTVVILEAMKLEINVVVDKHLNTAKVVKTVVQPGQAIEAGMPMILARMDE